MVRATIVMTSAWHLKLSDREAVWLKMYLQYPKDDDEAKDDREMRGSIFDALHKPTKL